MANLRDHIRSEIERGKLKEPFSVSDVTAFTDSQGRCRVGGGNYDPLWINSYLANHSTGPGTREGESVRRGGERLFIKHEKRGMYSLDYETYDLDREELEAIAKEEPRSNAKKSKILPECERIASTFVEYLHNKPFRILQNKGAWYPASAVTGWKRRLDQYHWNRSSWVTTQVGVNKFIHDIAVLEQKVLSGTTPAALLELEALRIYDAIRKWGNPNGTIRTGAFVLTCLKNAWNNQIAVVDSTLTKLYAFTRFNDYVIYDSRVAAAIMTIAEDTHRFRGERVPIPTGYQIIRVDTVADFQREFPKLGQYGGRGGTRPRGYRSTKWPQAYGNVGAQEDANRLCKCIVDALNRSKEDGRHWSLREVEAVLFMEGY